MTAEGSIDAVEWLRKQVEAAPDPVKELVTEMLGMLMSAEAGALCGASYGERSANRLNSRNGYRERDWNSRVGTVKLAIPKLRQGTYFPAWLLEPRRDSVYRWIESRGLPAHKVGRIWKFKLSQVDAWVEAGGAKSDEQEGGDR